MLTLFTYAMVTVALGGAIAALALHAASSLGARLLALALTAALLTGSYLAGNALLGRPKPARIALLERRASEAVVVASMNVEGEAIYLWLVLEGERAPRAYRLPWSVRLAEKLRRAQAQAKANGTRVHMRRPFRRNALESQRMFYVPPPPPMPPKPIG